MKHIPAAIIVAIFALTLGMRTNAADVRPNFVIIMADDLGYADIGCFGSRRVRTPHIDRLAEEGLRFTDFHSSGAVCSPTRAGLLTGRYQQRAGISTVIFADPKRPTHQHGLKASEHTFADLLSQAGYRTAIFGKWHLGYYPRYNPQRNGFDIFRGYVSGNVDFFSHVDQAGRLDWWQGETIKDEPGYTTHLITKHSVAFLKEQRDRPFCLYVPYEPPHYPYQGPGDKALRVVGKPRGAAERKQSMKDVRRAYREMVEEMDKGVGEIVAALKEQKLERRTLVMFFSDNGGTKQGENGPLRGFKGQLWEGGHRVPCVAWWPGTIEAGRVSNETAITLDIMPTMLDAAQVKVPDGHRLDGVSLLTTLTANKPLAARKLFWAHGNSKAMREGAWKLILAGRNAKPELYRLDKDLAESHDLAKQEPARVQSMTAAIEEWVQDTAAGATAQTD